MTRIESAHLTCPECGHSQDVRVHQSLNVDLDSSLRNKLLAGEINVFHCESCDCERRIDVPLLYHDVTRRYCVQYLPEEALTNDDMLSGYKQDGSLDTVGLPVKLTDATDYVFAPHIVFDLGEMIRYIHFRERLWTKDDKNS